MLKVKIKVNYKEYCQYIDGFLFSFGVLGKVVWIRIVRFIMVDVNKVIILINS